MLPSRGLRPVRPGQFTYARSNAARHFSSVNRNAGLRVQLRPAAGSQNSRHILLNSSTPANSTVTSSVPFSVRHGSWYAPWSWGKSSTPAGDAGAPTTSVAESHAPVNAWPEPVVTSQTPELAPAGIDKAAVVQDASTASDAASTASNAADPSDPLEALLQEVLASEKQYVPEIDPSALPIDHYGALKELGLDFGWGTSAMIEWLIEHLYLDLGLGWGACIVATSIIIRVGVFKLQAKASDGMAKMQCVKPIVEPLAKQMHQAMLDGDTAMQKVARAKQARVYKEIGLNPLTTFGPTFAQGVFGFGAFRCLRNMSILPVPQMELGGWLWFENLTISDPYYALPVLVGGITYFVVKKGGETGAMDAKPGMQAVMQVGLPSVMFFVATFQPASLQLYLLCTAILSGITATILRNPKARRWLKITPLPTPEAQRLWTKVASGEIPIEKVLRNGKVLPPSEVQAQVLPVYQAPNISTKSASTPKSSPLNTSNRQQLAAIKNRGINVKSTAAVPLHLQDESLRPQAKKQQIDRDHDYDTPPEGFFQKLDWFGRNYRFKYLKARAGMSIARMMGRSDIQGQLLQRKKDIAKRKSEEYEFRRRQRFRGE